jgi:hypothetical protein
LKVIRVVVHVGAVKIYVGTVEAVEGLKEKGKIG